MKTTLIDLTGLRYFRLLVIERASNRPPSKQTWWVCRCDCGKTKEIRGASLKNGMSKSCGCWHKQRIKESKSTHGMSRSTEYKSWLCMMARCYCEGNNRFKSYGARGIKVYEPWHKFENFIADMGLKPSPKHSIERLRNNEDYSPNNCKWATNLEQSRNKTTNILVSYMGETHCITEWGRKIGVSHATMSRRWHRGLRGEDLMSIKHLRAPA